jgi:hypothetical protein
MSDRVLSKIGSTILAHTHARATVDGRIVPACGAYDRAKLQSEVVVTGNASRVTCPACRIARAA